MNKMKIAAYCLVAALLAVSATACSGPSEADSEALTSITEISPDEMAVEQMTGQQESIEQTIPAADASATVDQLVGRWVDISMPERFASISKDGDGYQYEDNDGKYPAAFEEGMLKVKVSDTDSADVYMDSATGYLIVSYQGDVLEFQRE